MKAIKQSFLVALLIMLYKMVLTFDDFYERYLAVLCRSAGYCSVMTLKDKLTCQLPLDTVIYILLTENLE